MDAWPPRASLARRRLAVRHREEGRPHPELSAALVVARGERGMTVEAFAAEVGCAAAAADVVAAEDGSAPAHRLPAPLRRLLQAAPSPADRARGCLLAGAAGDALGAAIEFDSLDTIRGRHGPAGVTGLVPAYGRTGAITDDTQMTLFTAEGLLRAGPGGDRVAAVHAAYGRWLATQQTGPRRIPDDGRWLARHPFLHHRRAPGNTCLGALQAGRPVLDSKGCGGVMRVAPVGLLGLDPSAAFDLADRCAALTHGHPSGHLPAGALAATVTAVMAGEPLDAAVDAARSQLARHDGHEETSRVLALAVKLAAHTEPAAATLESLGEGWTGEEALAMSVYCALATPDVRQALLLAVNHGGDSDSTGAITGNLLGAAYGVDAVPAEWLDALEGRDVIEAVADDLLDGGSAHPERWPPPT